MSKIKNIQKQIESQIKEYYQNNCNTISSSQNTQKKQANQTKTKQQVFKKKNIKKEYQKRIHSKRKLKELTKKKIYLELSKKHSKQQAKQKLQQKQLTKQNPQKQQNMFEKIFNKLDKYLWVETNAVNRMNESHLVSHKVLFIIRVILCLYTTVVVIIQTIKIPNIGAFVEFLTFWGALCVQWYFIFTVIEMISFKINRKASYYMKIWKFTHLLFEFAFCSQLLIVLVFWGFIVPQLGSISQFGGLNILLNSQLHGGFFIAIIIDFIINNVEFIKRHLSVIYFLAIIYGLVNMVYSLIWSPVYPGITWKNWQTYVIFGFAFALFYFQHFIGTIVYKKWKNKNIQTIQESYIQQDYYF